MIYEAGRLVKKTGNAHHIILTANNYFIYDHEDYESTLKEMCDDPNDEMMLVYTRKPYHPEKGPVNKLEYAK